MPFTLPPNAPPTPPASPSRADGDEAFSAKADAHAAWMMIITTWFTGFVAWLITFIGEVNASFATIENDVESANNSKLSAAESAASALESKNVSAENKDISVSSAASALESKNFAQAAANQVDVAGALAGLPPRVGSAGKVPRIKSDESGFEYTASLDRLHVLSTAASLKNAVTAMLPIFDFKSTAIGTTAATGVVWAGSQFIIAGANGQSNCDTSPDGKTWTQRAVGFTYRQILSNGTNAIAIDVNANNAFRKSTDGGVTWSTSASGSQNIATAYRAYLASNKFIAVNGTQAGVTSDLGATWTATQTMPHTSQGVFAAGANFVSYTTSSGIYYTSSTGLTGSWTARTFPDSITASTLHSDCAGGLVLVPTSTSKNLWHTVDGITWTDLGFSQDSLKYGGLSDSTTNAAAFVCPVRINGCWVLFNGVTAGAGGAGAMVKYAGNTWVPMFVDAGGLVNTSATIKLVATNNAGVTVVKEPAANANVHVINTVSTKCIGNFI